MNIKVIPSVFSTFEREEIKAFNNYIGDVVIAIGDDFLTLRPHDAAILSAELKKLARQATKKNNKKTERFLCR